LRYFVIFAFLLCACLSSAAHAESETVTVGANRTTALGGFFIYQKQNCYSGGKVDYKVTNKPDHGKVTIRYERHQLGKSAGKCEGRPAGAMVVRYTPDRGFRGKDKIVVSFYFDKFAGGGAPRSRTVTYTVTVK